MTETVPGTVRTTDDPALKTFQWRISRDSDGKVTVEVGEQFDDKDLDETQVLQQLGWRAALTCLHLAGLDQESRVAILSIAMKIAGDLTLTVLKDVEA